MDPSSSSKTPSPPSTARDKLKSYLYFLLFCSPLLFLPLLSLSLFVPLLCGSTRSIIILVGSALKHTSLSLPCSFLPFPSVPSSHLLASSLHLLIPPYLSPSPCISSSWTSPAKDDRNTTFKPLAPLLHSLLLSLTSSSLTSPLSLSFVSLSSLPLFLFLIYKSISQQQQTDAGVR